MDHMDTLTAVCKARLETGAHADCQVTMTPRGWHEIREMAAAAPVAFGIDAVAWMRGLPVVVDDELDGDGRWQLVRTGTGEIVIDSATL